MIFGFDPRRLTTGDRLPFSESANAIPANNAKAARSAKNNFLVFILILLDHDKLETRHQFPIIRCGKGFPFSRSRDRASISF